MATQVMLKATIREERGKGGARKLRATGKLPGVVYGAGVDPIAVSLSAHDTTLLFHSISVDNTIVNLDVEGEKVPVPTLVREIQTHPIRPDILHVDFLRIQTGVEVELDIPVHLSGTPTGVRDDGGVLEQSVHHLPIRCIPANIPEEFLVDVAELEIGDAVHLADLAIPEGVELMVEGDRIICSVQAPTVLVVEDEEAEVEAEGEPELVGEEDEQSDEPGGEEDEE